MEKKIVLCPKHDCTGCNACYSICPTSCISMQEDNEGFLFPNIDFDKCIECGKCIKACPILSPSKTKRAIRPKTYACWHKDDSVRLLSSSGGIFSALAEETIKEKGIVYGAAYNNNMVVEHIGIDNLNKLNILRRSKYVQSNIGECFKEIKTHLTSGTKVLFTGTPCQVAGLNTFLGKDFDNLQTLDFICHGVPSPKVFKNYLNWLEIKFNKKLTSINFRDKKNGWENILASATSNNSEKIYLKGKLNSFYYGFIDGIFNRKCCSSCHYMTYPRPGDLTIADFWGIGDNVEFKYPQEKRKGISLVLDNSGKIPFFENKQLFFTERSLQEAEDRNSHLKRATPVHPKRESFFNEFNNVPFEFVLNKYLQLSIKRRLKNFIKEKFGFHIISSARKLAKKILK